MNAQTPQVPENERDLTPGEREIVNVLFGYIAKLAVSTTGRIPEPAGLLGIATRTLIRWKWEQGDLSFYPATLEATLPEIDLDDDSPEMNEDERKAVAAAVLAVTYIARWTPGRLPAKDGLLVRAVEAALNWLEQQEAREARRGATA